nr:putative nuclease HARBI1 [Pocillopora verrucosa]
MNRDVLMILANEVKPFLELSRGPHRDDVFSVEKQLAMTLYYLRDQGSILMTANAFGVALCTVSVVVRIVCYVSTNKCELNVIKLPTTEQEMMELVSKMENKFGFLLAFGCVDGTQIPILSPRENPHDYLSYKMEHTLNIQTVCNYKGTFLHVDVRWP